MLLIILMSNYHNTSSIGNTLTILQQFLLNIGYCNKNTIATCLDHYYKIYIIYFYFCSIYYRLRICGILTSVIDIYHFLGEQSHVPYSRNIMRYLLLFSFNPLSSPSFLPKYTISTASRGVTYKLKSKVVLTHLLCSQITH